MYKKLILIFIAFFMASYYLIQVYADYLQEEQKTADEEAGRIIQENIEERFKLFMKLPLSLATLGANYLSSEGLEKEYGIWAQKFLEINPEILGLNLVDPNGKIVKVYPPEKNLPSLGKMSQNFNQLMDSLRRDERYWLSAPFQLYQGKRGFALYIPVRQNGQFQGWLASVINTEIFFEHFKMTELLETYNLRIFDNVSEKTFFATSDSVPERHVISSKASLYGRELTFQSWRKDEKTFQVFPPFVVILLPFIIALVAAFIAYSIQQRKIVRKQLIEIEQLLKLTSKEAVSKLVDLHSENYHQENFDGNVSYITNLIEQIDLLQTMSQSKSGFDDEVLRFIVMLQSQLENFRDIISKKDLFILFNPKEFENVFLKTNDQLMQNSVLSNILSHCIIFAQHGSVVNINHRSNESEHVINFHIKKSLTPEKITTSLDRRMEVAKRILNIYHGQLHIQKDTNEGIIIQIAVPNPLGHV